MNYIIHVAHVASWTWGEPMTPAVGKLLNVRPDASYVLQLPMPMERRRAATPSVEAVSARATGVAVKTENMDAQATIFSPSNLRQYPRWIAGSRICRRRTLPLSPKDQKRLGSQTRALRHILMPYDLESSPWLLDDPENQKLLVGLFPLAETVILENLSTSGVGLHFYQSPLPAKPWPKTIAGVPVFFKPSSNELSSNVYMGTMPIGVVMESSKGPILGDRRYRVADDWVYLFRLVKRHFLNIRVSITEVMCLENYLLVVLEHRRPSDRWLPNSVADVPLRYRWEDEMGRQESYLGSTISGPPSSSKPFVGGIGDVVDNSTYGVLRPGLGVTATSAQEGEKAPPVSSTTGVLVRDESGETFMTMSSGRLDMVGYSAAHPAPEIGREIGEVAVCPYLASAGIALVWLNDTERFANVTFENRILPRVVQLRQLLGTRTRGAGVRTVFIDSPSTGCLEGNIVIPSFQRATKPEPRWVATMWCHMGQDSAPTLADEMAGSAVWTEQGNVVGLVRYAPKHGMMKDWCAATAADELIEVGFKLADPMTGPESTRRLLD